jgi:aromatic-amino-acid transaminase
MPLTQTNHSSLIPSASARPADDPIFTLNSEAQRRAQAGESIINATLGALMEDDGTLAILPTVVEAMQRVPIRRAAAYAPILGAKSFLDAALRDTFEGSAHSALATVSATPGGTGALYQAVTSFLEPGQALLTTSWFWSPYQTIASHARRAVETFDTFDASGRFDIGGLSAGLDRLIQRQGRALVVLNFPCHNPTGYSLDADEWRDVSEVVRRAGERAPVTLLLDLAYARFGAAGSNAWIAQVERVLETSTLLVAWTASKSFAQYGARVGALVAAHADAAERARIQNALAFSCRGTWSNCNHGGQLAIAELLSDAALRAQVDVQRDRLVGLLDERVQVFNREAARAGLRHPRYEGGFFVSVFVPDSEDVAGRMKQQGVFAVPLPGALRIALCSTPARDIPRLVSTMKEAIR